MRVLGTLKDLKSNSFQTHIINDGVVVSTADLELISVAHHAAVVNQPAHQQRSFRTGRVQASDARLRELPDCNATKRNAGMEPSVKMSMKK